MSTLYRWLHKIEGQEPSGTPANKTPAEIGVLTIGGCIYRLRTRVSR